MPDLDLYEQAKAIIESFAPKQPLFDPDKPWRIGTKQVVVWGIPVTYIEHEQLIEVRIV